MVVLNMSQALNLLQSLEDFRMIRKAMAQNQHSQWSFLFKSCTKFTYYNLVKVLYVLRKGMIAMSKTEAQRLKKMKSRTLQIFLKIVSHLLILWTRRRHMPWYTSGDQRTTSSPSTMWSSGNKHLYLMEESPQPISRL